MKIVIPDDYQDMVDRLACFALIRQHDVVRYRAPARDAGELAERLRDADVVVAIRERVEFSRALLEQLPRLKLIALVGRNSRAIDFSACTELGVAVATGNSNSPVAPAELALALMLASRRNVAFEAERMRRGEWPSTLSHRLRGSTLGILGLGAIGELVAQGGRGLGMEVLIWGRKSSRWAGGGPATPPSMSTSTSRSATIRSCRCRTFSARRISAGRNGKISNSISARRSSRSSPTNEGFRCGSPIRKCARDLLEWEGILGRRFQANSPAAG
jgi:D-3-phosphoglycerate dehydrogenase